MVATYTIGVDFGTLSARALLVNTKNGEEIAEATCDYLHGVMSETLAATGEPLPRDYALQDPSDYIAALQYVIPTVIAKAGVSPSEVIGIGIDFTCCTLLSVDESGIPLCEKPRFSHTPLAYAILWKHHAASVYAKQLTELAKKRGEAFLSRCGGKIDEEWAFPKMAQVFFEAPEVYHAAHAFVEAGDYIVWRLAGKLSRAYQYAAYKSHYDMEQGYPTKEYLSAFSPEFGETALQKLEGAVNEMGTLAGKITPEFATRLGLCENTAVAVACPDGHIAALSLGVSHAGDMMAVLGTSACFMALGEKNVRVPGICGTVRDGIVPGLYGFEAGLCCLGDHFAYAAERLTSPAYVQEAKERGISMMTLLCEKASALSPGESGVLALNWFNGNRSTLVDGKLSGAFVGMTLQTLPEHLMRALFEATAFGARHIVENYEANGVPIRRIVASGGIVYKNPFLMQLYADVLEREIAVTATAQAPAHSSAIVAATAAGAYADLESAISAMRSPVIRVYKPNGANFSTYRTLYAAYMRMHDWFGSKNCDLMYTLRELAQKQEGV